MARPRPITLLALFAAGIHGLSPLRASLTRPRAAVALHSTPDSSDTASPAVGGAPADGDAGPASDTAAAPTLAEDAAAAATDAVAVAPSFKLTRAWLSGKAGCLANLRTPEEAQTASTADSRPHYNWESSNELSCEVLAAASLLHSAE